MIYLYTAVISEENGTFYAKVPDIDGCVTTGKSISEAIDLITDALNAQVEGLAYPVKTKTGRFNQHISEGAVLIEVGNNMNTLREALDAMPYLARAIDEATRP